MRGRLGQIAMISSLTLMVATAGCSDQMTGTDDEDSDSQVQSPEDCRDDQTFNPLSNTCVDEPPFTIENDDNDAEDNTDDSGPSLTGDDCGPGALKGQACRPGGASLPSAQITVRGEDCDGDPFEMTTDTDEDGMYELDGIPSGQHILIIESGSFSTQQPLYINPDQVTDLSREAEKVCVDGANVDIALLDGGMDDIGTILNSLAVGYDVVGTDNGADLTFGGVANAGQFLTDLDEMLSYDIIFIECGGLWDELELSPDFDLNLITDNIRQYVQAGNSIYASDWAHPFIQQSLPDAIEFYNQHDDPDPSAARVGDDYTSDDPLVADVVSAEMSNLLGAESVPLQLTFMWVVAQEVGPNSTVHFQGDPRIIDDMVISTVDDAPLLVTYNDPNSVEGRAVFTSFHNQAQADEVIEEIMEYIIFQL